MTHENLSARAGTSLHPEHQFLGWAHRIVLNHFISSVRNKREFTHMENMPEQPVSASHEDRTASA